MLRAFKFSFRNIWRDIGLSFMTVVFMALATFMLATAVITYRMVLHGLETLERGVVLTLVLQPTATAEQAQDLINALQETKGVETATFKSADEVRADFIAKHKAEGDTLDATFDVLPANPLSAQITITASGVAAYSGWLDRFASGEYAELISNKNIADYQEVVGVLQKQVADPIRYAGYAIALVFSVITAILIFNTVRIAVYTQREEIGIMKLVGATNWFIRMPYVMQTVWLVLMGAMVAYAALYLSATFADPLVQNAFRWPDYHVTDELTVRFAQNFLQAGAILLAVSVAATFASLRRHLRV